MLPSFDFLPVQYFATSDISLLALAALGGLVIGWAFSSEKENKASAVCRFRGVIAVLGAVFGALAAFALVETIGLL